MHEAVQEWIAAEPQLNRFQLHLWYEDTTCTKIYGMP